MKGLGWDVPILKMVHNPGDWKGLVPRHRQVESGVKMSLTLKLSLQPNPASHKFTIELRYGIFSLLHGLHHQACSLKNGYLEDGLPGLVSG